MTTIDGFYANLIQASVVLEEIKLIKKMLLLERPLGKPVVHFLHSGLMWEVPAHGG